MPMTILSVSSCELDPTLGSGKTRLRWSEGLKALGHDVDVLEPRDFELWHGARRALRFRQALGAASAVVRRIRRRKYDLIEFFGGEFGIVTERLSRDSRRPFTVAHTDGFELLASEREREYDRPTTTSRRLRQWFQHHTHDRLSRAAFTYADAFVTGCELDRKRVLELEMFAPNRTAVISPGIDSEYLSAPSGDPREERVAFIGTWIPRKGVSYLVDVMNQVLHERPKLRLDVYGSHSPAGEVLARFKSNVRGQIAVRERLTNKQIAEGLSTASVFLFPTQYEGFGMALAEAMACGCAAVTTPTGFGAELRDGLEAIVCGYDDTSAMRRAVCALLNDDHLRSRISKAARNRVSTLTWTSQIAKLAAVYQAWLHGDSAVRIRRADA